MTVVAIPELILAVVSITAAPGAVLSMVLWPLDSGQFSLLGMGVDSWWKALVFGPAQIVLGLYLLGWVAPAVARGHAHAVRNLLAPSSAELETAKLAQRVEELILSHV